jgi:hypothetical protein
MKAAGLPSFKEAGKGSNWNRKRFGSGESSLSES